MLELVKALAIAQGKMSVPQMNGSNNAFKKPDGSATRYSTLADIIAATRPALTDNGIAAVQVANYVEGGISVETIFHGHGSSLPTGPVVIPVDKRSAQAVGSAFTYARRFSMSLACGVSGAEEDDDGNDAEKGAPKTGTELVAKLQDLMDQAGVSAEDVCKAYAVGSLSELSPDKYDAATARLVARLGARNATA